MSIRIVLRPRVTDLRPDMQRDLCGTVEPPCQSMPVLPTGLRRVVRGEIWHARTPGQAALATSLIVVAWSDVVSGSIPDLS